MLVSLAGPAGVGAWLLLPVPMRLDIVRVLGRLAAGCAELTLG